MKSRRVLILTVAALGLVAAVAAAAFYLSNRREVTTSSSAAYRAYREAVENEERYYFKEAKVGFAKALELDPEFAMAMLGLARNSDRDQGKSLTERARELRDRLTEREQLNVDLQYAFSRGKNEEGVKIARLIHEEYPQDVHAAMVLCEAEIAKGNSEKALQIFTDLLAIDPNNAQAYNQLGYQYAYRGDYDRAIENFQKYQFLASNQANPYDSMGEVQAYFGHYDEAVVNLGRALAIKPDFSSSYGNLGLVYEGRGDYAKAIDYFEKAADNSVTDGRRADYLFDALRVAFLIRDHATCARLADRIKSLPKDEFSDIRRSAFAAAGEILDNHPADAERMLRENKPKLNALLMKAVHLPGYKPYDEGWELLMGLALEAQGKDAEAITVYEEMANPPNPLRNLADHLWVYEGRAKLAALLAKRGDLNRAEKLLAENKRWNPSWAPTRAAEEAVAQARRGKVLAAAK